MPTATGKNGEKYELRGNQWVQISGPVGPEVPEDVARRNPRYAATDPAVQSQINEGMRQGLGTFLANVLSLPHAAGELLAAGGALPETAGGAALAAVRGQPMNIRERFANARKRQEGQLPASALLAIPDPTTEDVLAVPGAFRRSAAAVNANRDRAMGLLRGAPEAAMQSVQDPSLSRTFPAAVEAERQRAEENPLATSAGRTAGDAASLLALRPGDRIREILKLRQTAEPTARRSRLLVRERGEVEDARTRLDKATEALKPWLGRSAEAGFDGAVVSALGDGDPVATAGWSAGIQATGGAALAAKNWVWRNPGKSLFTMILASEIFKAVAPGPQNIAESKDEAVRAFVGAWGLAAAAGLAGSGRPTGAIMRSLSTVSRGSIASLVTQLQEASADGKDEYAKVLDQISKDPDYFGRETRQRLERAAQSEKPRALLNEIDALMNSTRFKKLFDEIE
jgi:hypothetical protein